MPVNHGSHGYWAPTTTPLQFPQLFFARPWPWIFSPIQLRAVSVGFSEETAVGESEKPMAKKMGGFDDHFLLDSDHPQGEKSIGANRGIASGNIYLDWSGKKSTIHDVAKYTNPPMNGLVGQVFVTFRKLIFGHVHNQLLGSQSVDTADVIWWIRFFWSLPISGDVDSSLFSQKVEINKELDHYPPLKIIGPSSWRVWFFFQPEKCCSHSQNFTVSR